MKPGQDNQLKPGKKPCQAACVALAGNNQVESDAEHVRDGKEGVA